MIGVFPEHDKLGKRLVVILKGFPCAYGRCSFCPFAIEQSLHTREVLEANKRIIEEAVEAADRGGYRRIAVFNGGSFHELPLDTIERLHHLSMGRVFEVEERSEYVTLESLRFLLKVLEPEKLIVRVGFETIREETREKLLRKGMPDSELYRLSRLRLEARREGLPVEIWTYLLFGLKGISEDEVRESLRAFKKLFDGVIAVRYKKYLPAHPEPAPVSRELALLLEREADLVDWGGDQWVIGGKQGSAPA